MKKLITTVLGVNIVAFIVLLVAGSSFWAALSPLITQIIIIIILGVTYKYEQS